MSSDLLSTLKTIQLYGYSPVIIITVVGYDYFLTFSREIDAVWCRPWTWVSTLFVVVRYVGLCWAVTLALAGSTYVPGPVNVSIALLEIGDWGFSLFLAAADFVMILRVYAMWNRSKAILGVLLFIYVPQVIVNIVWELVYNNPDKTLSVTIGQVLDLKFCNYITTTAPLATYRAIPRFVLGAALLILAVIPTLTQSIEMYKMTKRWHTNETMELLVREGTVYFVVNLLFNIVNAIRLPIADLMMFMDTLSYSLCCVLMPRFIISIRGLYDRDLRERWKGIDTGFGRYLEQSYSASEGADTVGGEAIELEDVGDDEWRV